MPRPLSEREKACRKYLSFGVKTCVCCKRVLQATPLTRPGGRQVVVFQPSTLKCETCVVLGLAARTGLEMDKPAEKQS
jgi:hypothetical protein